MISTTLSSAPPPLSDNVRPARKGPLPGEPVPTAKSSTVKACACPLRGNDKQTAARPRVDTAIKPQPMQASGHGGWRAQPAVVVFLSGMAGRTLGKRRSRLSRGCFLPRPTGKTALQIIQPRTRGQACAEAVYARGSFSNQLRG